MSVPVAPRASRYGPRPDRRRPDREGPLGGGQGALDVARAEAPLGEGLERRGAARRAAGRPLEVARGPARVAPRERDPPAGDEGVDPLGGREDGPLGRGGRGLDLAAPEGDLDPERGRRPGLGLEPGQRLGRAARVAEVEPDRGGLDPGRRRDGLGPEERLGPLAGLGPGPVRAGGPGLLEERGRRGGRRRVAGRGRRLAPAIRPERRDRPGQADPGQEQSARGEGGPAPGAPPRPRRDGLAAQVALEVGAQGAASA